MQTLLIKNRPLKRKILKLAWPTIIENILETTVGFVDSLMIAGVGLYAVGGVGIANAVINVYIAIFIALGIGTSSLISRSLGAENQGKARKVALQSLVLASIIGCLLGIISLVFGQQLLGLMGASAKTLNYSFQFLQLVGGSAIVISLMIILGSILRAAGDTKFPMKVGFVVNGINIALDLILISGWGPIPALGVRGSAIATVIARIIGIVLLYKTIQKSELAFSLKDLLKNSSYSELLKLSLPAAMERLVMRLGQVVYFGFIVAIGAKTYSSHSIAGTIESLVYMPAYGLATAGSILTGNSIGKKDFKEAKDVAFITVWYGILILSFLGIFLFFGTPLIATLFTKDTEAIRQIVIALRIDAFNQPGLAASLILVGLLQGMGDTKSPLYSTAIGMWIIRILGIVVFCQLFNLGIAGVWISIGIDLYVRTIFLLYRYKANIRKYMQNEVQRQMPINDG